MKELHNIDENSTQLKPEGGLQASLCSNEVLSCSSPLGFINTSFISEDEAIDYLAEILVESYLDDKKRYANTNPKKSSDLLPSINQRTS
jgi:hypothetical protein